MIKRVKKNKRSVFITFLVSYISTLLIPTMIGVVSYKQSMQALKNKVEGYTVAMVEQAQQVIDERMRSIDQLLLDISLNPRIQRFMYKKHPVTSTDIYAMKEVIRDIAKYKNTNSLVEELYLYFNNTNSVLINSGKHNCEFFYNEFIPYTDMSYEEWSQLLEQNLYKRFIPVKTLASNQKKVITYLQSLPFGTRGKVLGTIGILINAESIERLLSNINMLNKGAVYIVNEQDEIIMQIGHLSSAYDVRALELCKMTKNNYFYDRINKQEVIISCILSEYNDWKYISIIPTSIFMADLKTIKAITIGVMVIGLGLGVLLSYFMARKNYLPIKRLVENIQEKLIGFSSNIKNEIVFIEEATSATVRENQRIKAMLEKQYPILRTNLLIQLLKGTIDNGHDFSESLKSFDIKFPYSQFCTLIIYVDDCSQFLKSDSIQEYSLLKIVIANIMEELGNKYHICYMVDLDWDHMALVINLNPKHIEWKDQIKSIAVKTREVLSREFSIFISIGIGNRYDGISAISKSYKEAVQAMEYRMVKGKYSVIFFDEIIASHQNYYYPLDTEKQLLNSIKVGDYEKATNLLRDIIKQNFINRSLPLEMARCLFFDIMSTIIKILNDINVDYSKVFEGDFEEMETLINCKTIDDMYNIISLILNKICSYINENKRSHNERLKQEILIYIDEHYVDNSISLSKIAEAFEITPTYLSSFFKEQTGENIMDYINKLRLVRVKELLEQTSLNLTAVAEKVGYTNSAVLIRTFKKYEGITPGQYRQHHIS